MRIAVVFVAMTLLAGAAAPAAACIGPRQPRAHTSLLPAIEGSMAHWPSNLSITAGSLLSLQLPLGAKVTIAKGDATDARDGTTVQSLTEARFRELIAEGRQTAYDPLPSPKTYGWQRFGGAGPGEALLTIAIGPYPMPIRILVLPAIQVSPGVVITGKPGEGTTERPLSPDGNDSIELILPGEVGDAWSVTPASESGFALVRIEPSPDATEATPRVRLTFRHSGSARGKVIAATRGRGLRSESFTFAIFHKPTPLC